MNQRFLPFMYLPAITLIGAVAIASALSAQSPAPSRFEVASIRPSLSPGQIGQAIGTALRTGGTPPAPSAIPIGIRTFPGGRFTANASLRTLVAHVYEVKEYQIEGGPTWLDEDYFVIDARAARETTPAEFNEMVKTLLAERFEFRGRATTRPGKTYNLVLAQPGGKVPPGLKRAPSECVAQVEERKRRAAARQASSAGQAPPSAAPGPDPTPRCGVTRMSSGLILGGATTMTASGQPLLHLVERLVFELGTTVVDRTGLEGLFDFVVEFDAKPAVSLPGLARSGLDPNGNDSPKPPLPTAIERQLGLKLEAVEGPVPAFVIEAAERPTAN
jgi:uncharacterized protein (TIGR03435 family)